MGFFSWKTSDTNESIMNHHTEHCQTVYLLQPDGAEPIEETAYDGYGVFGGVDAYEWLAERNLTEDSFNAIAAEGHPNAMRNAGIAIESGLRLYQDPETGVYCAYHDPALEPLLELVARTVGTDKLAYFTDYETIIDGIDLTANQLREQGRLVTANVSKIYIKEDLPLKFSFDKAAVYEDLPAAETCPNQGFFMDSSMEP